MVSLLELYAVLLSNRNYSAQQIFQPLFPWKVMRKYMFEYHLDEEV